MINIAICDDNPQICDLIEDILFYYSKAHGVNIENFHFYTVESLEFSISRGNHYNLIYLDIEFPEKSGIELAHFIRNIREDCSTEIIFISGSDKYFKDLLKFQPISFVSKPFIDSDIIKSFEIFLRRLDALNLKFKYRKGGTAYLVPLNKIFYFESEGKKINIYSEIFLDYFYGNLSELDKGFNNKNFIRVHKSYIVNFDKVNCVTRNALLLSNGKEIPVGRKYSNQVQNTVMKMRSYG